MPLALHSSEPKFLFFWNRKVASSSLLHGLKGEFPELRLYAQPAFRPPRRDDGWPRFMVVRNPLARVVSCFRNKCLDAPEALSRNGNLEPCQLHLLRAMGAWPCSLRTGARRLSELSFPEFVSLLPAVRDGNSHFRLQMDVLRHAPAPPSLPSWAGRMVGTIFHLGRTHYLTPAFLKGRPAPNRDRALLEEVRRQRVHWVRLEELGQEWPTVEEAVGRRIPLPWQVRTAQGEDWRELYDPDLQKRVSDLYRPDLELFGYGEGSD